MWQIYNTSINTYNDSLTSCDNSNNFGFSLDCGEAITVCLAKQLAILNQSISAQVTAGPHRPWYTLGVTLRGKCATQHFCMRGQ